MRKWILGSAAVLAVLAVATALFYRSAHQQLWALEQTGVTTAVYGANLVTVDRVERFVADEAYTIVFGQDGQGNKRIVWVGAKETHTELVSAGVAADDVSAKVEQNHPDNEVLRVIPGKLADNFVWEVFYKRMEEKGERYYYDYFDFYTGAHLETYTLTVK